MFSSIITAKGVRQMEYGTFSLSNIISFHQLNMPEPVNLLPGTICSALGMLIGSAVKKIK